MGTVEEGPECISCPFNCYYCVSPQTCTVCNNITSLHNGRCKYLCPVGFYADYGICAACDMPFCLTCSGPNNCTSCDTSSGAALSNGSCVIVCPVGCFPDTQLTQCVNCTQGCSFCSNSSYCTACDTGYIEYEGSCLLSCPEGTYAVVDICWSCQSGCLLCTGPLNCSLCQSNYSMVIASNGYT